MLHRSKIFKRIYKNKASQMRYRYGVYYKYKVRKFQNADQRKRYYKNPSKFKVITYKRKIKRKYLF